MENLDREMIHDLRAEGAEVADLDEMIGQERKYILIAYEVYANGTTSESPVIDQGIAREIGERMKIGPPTDPVGYGIWEVPSG